MSTGEALLLKEALKPVSGIVDALIGPKIDRLKKWSKNKDIEAQIESDKLRKLLTEHTKRTIKKVSELSTIVFPQQKINIKDVYTPLKLRAIDNYYSQRNINSSAKINPYAEGKSYLIIDNAGMGKSTYSKALCLFLIEKTQKIPIFFEVLDFNNKLSLVENLAKTLDDLDSQFDRDLFRKILVAGYFFIIIDGFDEATSGDKEILIPQLRELSEKKAKASLVLTSRPEERLPSLIDSTTYSLEPLNIRQVNVLLKKYDELANSNIGERLKKEIKKVPERFLKTPLLVGLLYRTFGFNLSIADKITVFYSEIYEALYKGHDLTKNGYVREKISKLDIDEFRKLLRSFAYQYIIRRETKEHTHDSLINLIREAKEFCSHPELVERNFLTDLILSVPLITKEGNILKFIHRSIAEYFAAEFITNIDERKALLSSILKSDIRPIFKETIEYIGEIEPNLYQEIVTSPIAEQFLLHKSRQPINTSELYKTTTFISEFFISYWEREKVLSHKNNDTQITIPRQNLSGEFRELHYLYGSHDNKNYIAVITFNSEKTHIPTKALAELSEQLDVENFIVTSDKDIAEIKNILQIGKWYNHSDPEIIKNSNLESICHLMTRHTSRMRGNASFISENKCKQVLGSKNKKLEAEKGLMELLKIK